MLMPAVKTTYTQGIIEFLNKPTVTSALGAQRLVIDRKEDFNSIYRLALMTNIYNILDERLMTNIDNILDERPVVCLQQRLLLVFITHIAIILHFAYNQLGARKESNRKKVTDKK